MCRYPWDSRCVRIARFFWSCVLSASQKITRNWTLLKSRLLITSYSAPSTSKLKKSMWFPVKTEFLFMHWEGRNPPQACHLCLLADATSTERMVTWTPRYCYPSKTNKNLNVALHPAPLARQKRCRHKAHQVSVVLTSFFFGSLRPGQALRILRQPLSHDAHCR